MDLIPESPLLLDSYDSPEPRSESTFRTQRAPSFRTYEPSVLSHPTPESILTALNSQPDAGPSDLDARAALVLQHSLRWAVEYGDVDLIIWLTGLEGRWKDVLNSLVNAYEDEDGWGLVGAAIQASCGRDELEEGVRAIVARWGLDKRKDKTGWTPLHLAALVSTPPLVSFLLTRGASPHAITNRGLTPHDLIAGVEDRLQVAVLLEQAAIESPIPHHDAVISEGRQRLLKRRRDNMSHRVVDDTEESARAERKKWVRERVKIVGVNVDTLYGPPTTDPEPLDEQAIVEEEDFELVFAPYQLPAIFDTIISRYRPICQPAHHRGLPANTLYLYARFALSKCDDAWLEELIEGAVERIEQTVYAHVDDLAYLAFWSYNSTLLLHLLTTEEGMRTACDELGLLSMLEELINAIHVFIIRVAERQIDTILDDSILDYETLEEVGDVRFEGEWTLFRTLGKKSAPKANFTDNDSSGLFNSLRGVSPFKTAQRQQSMHDIRGVALSTPLNKPQNVVDILTGVLVVLQLYQVNPALTVQAFSQIFFWIACELFNRILTRKKYLCRSKAVQIRMNMTALEDWVRTNGIPTKCASIYLEPVLQLIQWLQLQSSIASFNDLIGTVQGLSALNPLQMRKALRDYRYEVNEGRMEEESALYLGQLQRDWERRRVETSVKVLQAEQANQDTPKADSGTPIDALFDGTTSLADFEPASLPECFGELLDSRYMLPFQLPDDPAFLVATPPEDAFNTSLVPLDGRPASRSSFSSSRPLGWALPSRLSIRELPDDFFAWMKEQEVYTRQKRQRPSQLSIQPILLLHSPPPLSVPQSIGTPARRETRDDTTPTATIKPLNASMSSPSIDRFREQFQSSFQPIPKLQHARTESYELKVALNPVYQHSPRTRPASEVAPRSVFGLNGDSPGSPGSLRSGMGTGPKSPTGSSSSGRKWWTLVKKPSLADLSASLKSPRRGASSSTDGDEIGMGEFGVNAGESDTGDETIKAGNGRSGIQSAGFWQKP